jgi:hypothetical protein
MDTTKTHKVTVVTSSKDTTISKSNKTNSFEKYTVDTITIKKDSNCDWVVPVKDLTTILIWPVLILIIILIFKEEIRELIKRITELSIGKDGIKILSPKEKEKEQEEKKDEEEKEKQEVEEIIGLESTNLRKRRLEEIKSPLSTFDKMKIKILTTFWKFQKDKNDDIRFTFTITNKDKEYDDFLYAMKELIDKGFVRQDSFSKQFYLTLRGIELCRNNEQLLQSKVFKL